MTVRGTAQFALFAQDPPARVTRKRPKADTEDQRSARQVRDELAPWPCVHHSQHYCCDECDERFPTDGAGFPHRQDAGGRKPMRICASCKFPRPPDKWNHQDRLHCTWCVPLV